jgi:hypothetical protein
MKPVLRGRDIEKYYYKWAGLWVIIIPAGWTNENRGKENPEEFFRKTFPALYKHFMNFSNVKTRGKGLFDRDDQGDYWWELRRCDYYSEFEKEKIVWQRVTQTPRFTLVHSGYYCEATTHFITTNENNQGIRKYLLGIFNSKTFKFVFYKFYMGGGIEGEIKGEFIGRFPIPLITKETQPIASQIIQKVDKILSFTQSKDYEADIVKQQKVKELEKEIDKLVYKLYNLTEEEIEIIEGEK